MTYRPHLSTLMRGVMVSGAALATDASAVAMALARMAELTTIFTDIRYLPMGLRSCPDWTRAIRTAREVCYSVAIRAARPLSIWLALRGLAMVIRQPAKVLHWKNAQASPNTYYRVSHDSREFQSGAKRQGHEPGAP